jgi:hypothetical protein
MSPPDEFSHASTWVWILSALVVVGFVGLFFPAGHTDPGGSTRAMAKNDATQIATAINGYLSEYGKLPAQGDGNVNSAELMYKLVGAVGNENPRGVVFLEVPRAKSHKNGAEATDGIYTSGYKDSWGNEYEIRIDNESPSKAYDGNVEGPDGTVRKSVIVWSRGNPKKPESYSNKSKWIKSWE